ncbi:MAG TPA: hypothetical protein VLJ59_21445 [Mycobacteriales bacterium]|nr:hypothetical protein [Mycobacteriales bacterium]
MILAQPVAGQLPGSLAGLGEHPVLAGVAVLALVGVLSVWRSGRGQARRAGQVVSLAGRIVVTAGLIVAVQWVVFAYGGLTARVVVLGLPALFAAHTLTHAVTVTPGQARRGGRR